MQQLGVGLPDVPVPMREKGCMSQLAQGAMYGFGVGTAGTLVATAWTTSFLKKGITEGMLVARFGRTVYPPALALFTVFPLVDCTARDNGWKNTTSRAAFAGAMTGAVMNAGVWGSMGAVVKGVIAGATIGAAYDVTDLLLGKRMGPEARARRTYAMDVDAVASTAARLSQSREAYAPQPGVSARGNLIQGDAARQ